MKTVVLWLCLALPSAFLYAQNSISGQVIENETGEGLPFALVKNQTTEQTVKTDMDGAFTLPISSPEDSVLILYSGYKNQVVLAKDLSLVQMQLSVTTMDEVVVTAGRTEQKRSESPVAIDVITAETIEDNKPTTIDQVLNQSAGVYMVDLGNEQHTMSIRRPIDYGASYLYLEDGIPIRASGVFNHNALLEINMASVSRMEIIKGPSSSLYGGEGIGGTVNFITLKPSVEPSASISVQGNNIAYRRTDFSAANTFNKLGVRISGYYAQQRNGYIEHSDFDKLALTLGLNNRLSENSELIWNTTVVNYQADMTGSLDSVAFYEKEYSSNQTFTNREVDALRSHLSFKHYWNDSSHTVFTGYYRNNSIKQNPSYRVSDDFKPWSGQGDPNLAHGVLNDNAFHSLGAIAVHQQQFKFLNGSVTAGASFDFSPNSYEEDYISIYKNNEGMYESFAETDSSLADYRANLYNAAAFAQYQFEPIKKLRVTLGGRYDYYLYDYKNNLDSNAFSGVPDSKDVYQRFTPKVGATYQLSRRAGVYANFSQGYVAPQVGQLYRGVKVPQLKPTYYNNYEVGGWFGFWKGRAKLDVSVYQMDGKDEIMSLYHDDGTIDMVNAGATRHQGIEYELHVKVTKDILVRISGTNAVHTFVTYSEVGRDQNGNSVNVDYSDKEMPQAPKWMANAQITYKPSYFKGFRISAEWQHISQYYMDINNTKTYPGYNVFNIRLGYEWKMLECWINILNVSDELYATVARSSTWGDSYSVGKPRNFNVGIGYNFRGK